MGTGNAVKPPYHQIRPGGSGGADQGFRRIGGKAVVSVHKLEILPCGGVHPRVAGCGHPGVGLVDHMKAAVCRRCRLAQGQAAVLAAVVDQPDLQLAPGLVSDALQTGGEILLYVINWDNDADKRSFHRATPFSMICFLL